MLPPGYYPQAGLPVVPQPYARATLPPAQPLAQAVAPAPKVRMQAPEEPRPAARPAVVIPSPEQLGLAPVPSSGVDWEATRGRLRQMGATSFLIDRAPAGGYCFSCWVPAEQAGKSYRVDAEGATEAEAVRLCLERADRWVRRSP
jgi:hypothetical protein